MDDGLLTIDDVRNGLRLKVERLRKQQQMSELNPQQPPNIIAGLREAGIRYSKRNLGVGATKPPRIGGV